MRCRIRRFAEKSGRTGFPVRPSVYGAAVDFARAR